MIKMTGLKMVQNKKVKSYSLGMKQRLGVATALISDPDVIILDEPFNGLDVDGIKWLRKLFKQLAEEGKAVIVSSHLMGEIQAVADRRSEEHTSELQSRGHLVCRLLLEKKKNTKRGR